MKQRTKVDNNDKRPNRNGYERYSSPTLHRTEQLWSSKDAIPSWRTQPLPIRNMDSQIDYQSLHEALQGLVSVESVGNESMDQQIGSETLLEMLGAQRDLEQEMNAIEQQISSHRYRSSEKIDPFQEPSIVRILYMGASSERDKRRVFKKISKGLSEALQVQCPSSSLYKFKERKHNLVLISLLPDDDNAVETYEDYGLSIIEADFGWSSLGLEKAELDRTLLRYIQTQIKAASKEEDEEEEKKKEKKKGSPLNEPFDGFVYPEKSPNGIDLCIYFYNVSCHVEESYVKDDMVILWKLKKLGVPIIPVLPVNRSCTDDERRLHLANLLAQYKIRCVDLSAFNLDVGQAPSFKKRRDSRTKDQANSGLEEQLGNEWAASSTTSPAPYQILTIDQFVAMDQRAVFAILKQTREQALLDRRAYPVAESITKSSSTSTASLPATTSIPQISTLTPHLKRLPCHHSKSRFLLFLFVVIATIFVLSCRIRPKAQSRRDPTPWIAYLTLAPSAQTSTLGFYLDLYDPAGNPSWPQRGEPTVMLSGNPGPPMARIDETIGKYNFNVSLSKCRNHHSKTQSIIIDVQLPFERYVVEGNHIIVSPQACSNNHHHPTSPSSSSFSSSSVDVAQDVCRIASEQKSYRSMSWHEWPKFLFEHRFKLLDIMFSGENL